MLGCTLDRRIRSVWNEEGESVRCSWTVLPVELPAFQVLIQCRSRNAQNAADLRRCVFSVVVELVEQLDLSSAQLWPSPALLPSRPGGRKASQCALLDEIPLKLRQRAENLEHELPAAGRGVDGS